MYSQIGTRGTREVKHTGLSPEREKYIYTVLYLQAWENTWLVVW